jgi:hypothetical protein
MVLLTAHRIQSYWISEPYPSFSILTSARGVVHGTPFFGMRYRCVLYVILDEGKVQKSDNLKRSYRFVLQS